MKQIAVFLTLVLLMFQRAPAEEGEKIDIHINQVSLASVISWLYPTNSGVTVIVSSDAHAILHNSSIDFDTGESGTVLEADAIKDLKTTIMKQTGVVITRVDASTISVTVNDALVQALKRRDRGHLRKVMPTSECSENRDAASIFRFRAGGAGSRIRTVRCTVNN